MTRHSVQGIYAVVDPRFLPAGRDVAEFTRAFLDGGGRLVQLRVKDAGPALSAERRRLADAIMALKNEYDFTFVMNDDVAGARAVAADGVHVGQDDPPISVVRATLGSDLLIGYSAHTVAEAVTAAAAGADYVALGAIYPTATKGPGHPVQGVTVLRHVVQAVHIPVVAIGGITRANVDTVWQAGAAAVAMITGLTQAADVRAETQWHVRAWEQWQSSHTRCTDRSVA
ncbi:MAG: thiamine phosphate synthase [Deltaproteobacteria bacterium]|nr:thiamine phosphate synthase [Deltaproteobacteria bacterium]